MNDEKAQLIHAKTTHDKLMMKRPVNIWQLMNINTMREYCIRLCILENIFSGVVIRLNRKLYHIPCIPSAKTKSLNLYIKPIVAQSEILRIQF